MNTKQPMSLLLIEDDIIECKKYTDYTSKRKDVTFVGVTCSCEEALHYVQTSSPEGIILDLMLNEGQGSGIQFLTELQDIDLPFRPLIIVTTYSSSPVIYSHVLDAGADFVFHKSQSGYCPELVISTCLSLRKALHTSQRGAMPSAMCVHETTEQKEERITKKIEHELSLIGIHSKFKGSKYICDAIYFLINQKKSDSASAIQYVADKYERNYSTVMRVMQIAIKTAWKNSSVQDILDNYKTRILAKSGIPSTSEFIHYYAEKIRGTL